MTAGNARQARACPRWCDYRDGGVHPPTHVQHAGDLVTTLWPQGRIVALTVETGAADDTPRAVLTIADEVKAVTARLTWPEAEKVARHILDAAGRHGNGGAR